MTGSPIAVAWLRVHVIKGSGKSRSRRFCRRLRHWWRRAIAIATAGASHSRLASSAAVSAGCVLLPAASSSGCLACSSWRACRLSGGYPLRRLVYRFWRQQAPSQQGFTRLLHRVKLCQHRLALCWVSSNDLPPSELDALLIWT